MTAYPPDDDGWRACKDDLAMGRIYPDGSPRDPEPPDDAYGDSPAELLPKPRRVRRPFESGAFRIGRFEITVRRRATAPCGACQGRGWFHTLGASDPHPAPPGYDSVALCGCGTAHDNLNDTRRQMRQYEREQRSGKPPF